MEVKTLKKKCKSVSESAKEAYINVVVNILIDFELNGFFKKCCQPKKKDGFEFATFRSLISFDWR